MTLSQPSASPITVDYETVADTATAGRDYVSARDTLVFQPGETAKTLGVSVLGNRIHGAEKAFFERLSTAEGVELTDSVGRVTILPRGLCVCESMDVELGYSGYVRGATSDWTLFALSLRYHLKCTAGDKSNCRGRYQLLWAEGPRDSGAHIPREDKPDVECASLKCDSVTGKSDFRLRIRTSALAGDGATVRIKVRYGCLTGEVLRQHVETFTLQLDRDGLDRGRSDLSGRRDPSR